VPGFPVGAEAPPTVPAVPFPLHRIPRPLAVAVVAAVACASTVLTASAASADERTGDVVVTMPSKIVLNGETFPVSATSSDLYSSLDKVWLNVYRGDDLQTLEDAAPNTTVQMDTTGVAPGLLVAKADLPRTDCDFSSDSRCHWNSDLTWYYEFVDGLTFHDSAPAVAKYGSSVRLSGVNVGTATTWTATAKRWDGDEWTAWSGADVAIGPKHVTTDGRGTATWVERTRALHRFTATAAETDTVWSAASGAVAAAKPKPVAKPGRVRASASASKAATAMKKGLPTVRRVVALTKRTDVNHLLGRANGYTSAAVLYDRRTTCSDGPGVDCGATIEKFTTTAKAKARARHVQTLLKRYHLGTEHDFVHGHFLLRVSGDLTRSQAAKYRTVFTKVF